MSISGNPTIAPGSTRPDSSTQSVALVTGGDEGFALGMTVMLTSAIAHLPRDQPLRIFLLDGGVSPATRKRMETALTARGRRADLVWLTPDPARLDGVPLNTRHTLSAYLRLLIPELLPPDVHRVIYLDGDVVIEHDLMDLWSMDMEDAPAMAVENYSSPRVADPGSLPETYTACGLAPDDLYCNTGVMLIDLDRWRADDVGQKVIDYSRRYAQHVRYADQDGLNALFGARWGRLDPRWNVQILTIQKLAESEPITPAERREKQKSVLREAYVLHYAGHLKPWSHRYRRQRGDRFLHYARMSGWFGPLEGKLWSATRLVSQKALYVGARIRDALAIPAGGRG